MLSCNIDTPVLNVWNFVCIHACMFVRGMFIEVYISTYVWTYVCTCVCMYAYMYAWVNACTFAHKWMIIPNSGISFNSFNLFHSSISLSQCFVTTGHTKQPMPLYRIFCAFFFLPRTIVPKWEVWVVPMPRCRVPLPPPTRKWWEESDMCVQPTWKLVRNSTQTWSRSWRMKANERDINPRFMRKLGRH